MLNMKKTLTKILTSVKSLTDTTSALSTKTTTAFKKTWVQTSATTLGSHAGAWKYATASIPSGYTAYCLVQPGVNHGWVNISGQSLSASGSTATAGFFCQNITTGAISCRADGYIIFIKSSLL